MGLTLGKTGPVRAQQDLKQYNAGALLTAQQLANPYLAKHFSNPGFHYAGPEGMLSPEAVAFWNTAQGRGESNNWTNILAGRKGAGVINNALAWVPEVTGTTALARKLREPLNDALPFMDDIATWAETNPADAGLAVAGGVGFGTGLAALASGGGATVGAGTGGGVAAGTGGGAGAGTVAGTGAGAGVGAGTASMGTLAPIVTTGTTTSGLGAGMLAGAGAGAGAGLLAGSGAGGGSSGGGGGGSTGFSLGGMDMGSLFGIGSSLYGLYQSKQQMDMAEDALKASDPFGPYRAAYANQLQVLMANPGSITSDPGYQFQFDQGAEAVSRKMGAAGYLGSGNMGTALTQYGQDFATNYLNNKIQQLAGLAGANIGPNAGPAMAGYANGIGTASSSLASLGYTLEDTDWSWLRHVFGAGE